MTNVCEREREYVDLDVDVDVNAVSSVENWEVIGSCNAICCVFWSLLFVVSTLYNIVIVIGCISSLSFLSSWDVMNTEIKDKSLSARHHIDNGIGLHVRTTLHRFLCYTSARHWHTDYIRRLMRKLAARWTITALSAPMPLSAHSAHVFVWAIIFCCCFLSHLENNINSSNINNRRKYTHAHVHATFTDNNTITQTKMKMAHIENRRRVHDTTFYIAY